MISRATKSITDTGIKVSKTLYSKTKEGLGKIMTRETMSNIKNKVFYFMNDENEDSENKNLNLTSKYKRRDDKTRYNFTNDNTASTIHPGRRQSMNYRNKRVATFYCD
mmetsp:Transcript_6627/g.5729  ORF Transcript_6627/g.5729 Transcript_6627/m.5729 type:complete len:108 (+) Transcript_6627:958-1281(+)